VSRRAPPHCRPVQDESSHSRQALLEHNHHNTLLFRGAASGKAFRVVVVAVSTTIHVVNLTHGDPPLQRRRRQVIPALRFARSNAVVVSTRLAALVAFYYRSWVIRRLRSLSLLLVAKNRFQNRSCNCKKSIGARAGKAHSSNMSSADGQSLGFLRAGVCLVFAFLGAQHVCYYSSSRSLLALEAPSFTTAVLPPGGK
jgi:hypothetical protein